MHHAPASTRDRRPSSAAVAGAVLLAALTLLAYLPALRAGYVGDDEQYVTDNATLRSVEGLWQIWFDPPATPQYYPLVFTTFWVEYQLWGLAPAGYHITNVVLHAVNALALWLVLHRLRVPGAWLAAAIFALHPVHVESVAWITERKDVLSGLFFLLAVLWWLRFVESGRRRHYLLVTLLFTGALLSKTMTGTLPLLLGLVEWWRDPARLRGRLASLFPLLLLSAAAMSLTFWREHLLDRSDIVMRALSPVDRLLIAGRAFWFYLGKLVWPAPLMTYYPRWQIDATAAWQYLFPLGAGALFAALWVARRRLGPGPLAAALFFAVMLAPVLGLVDFNFMTFAYVADHFQYLPSIGPIALFAAALAATARAAALPPAVAPAAAGALLAVLGLLSWRHAGTFTDVETQMRDCLAKNPAAAGAHYNLGTVLLHQGKADEALAHFVESLRYKPDYADAHNNLGVVLWQRGQRDAAMDHFAAAARLQPFDFKPEQNLGGALVLLGREDEAVAHYQAAVRLNPRSADAHRELGTLVLTQGKPAEAAAHLASAVELNPDDTPARKQWAQALLAQGRTDAAMEQYALLVRAEPADVALRSALATALLQQGRFAAAIEHFAAAARLQPDQADLRNNWGAALGGLGRTSEAIEQFTEALRIDPDNADARANLEQALAAQRTPDSGQRPPP